MKVTVEVETLDNDGNPIEAGCYKQIDPTGEGIMSRNVDRYAKYRGTGKARVTVPIAEKQGGPGYSSIMVGVEISIPCNSDSISVRKVTDMLIADGLEIVDNHIYQAYDILLTHREELNKKLEEGDWNG